MLKSVCKTFISMLSIAALVTTFVVCMGLRGAHAESEAIRIELVVDAPDVYSVYYTAYIQDERACSGGAADLDGNELEEGRVLEYVIPLEMLGEDADLTAFSIDFSPFGREESQEAGRTNAVAFPAEAGMTYRIHLVQMDGEFLAVPEWETGEKFTIEIGGNVMPDEVDFSYLHVDYYLGDAQCGYMYACVNEGEDVIRIEFPKDVFEGIAEDPNLTDFRAELYLSYSDFKGDEAVLQAMYGNTGTDEYLATLDFPAEFGKTYRYTLTGDAKEGYTLSEAE